MIVLGVGFSSRCGADALAELVATVREQASRELGEAVDNGLLATSERKRGAGVLEAVAARLGLTPVYIAQQALLAQQAAVPGYSAVAAAATGFGSVAEAAAMAALTDDRRLIVPRLKAGMATCAAASGSTRSDP